jgi:pyruvate dehydrogenase E2 component (dihydrolipoamide acetyltransferase)
LEYIIIMSYQSVQETLMGDSIRMPDLGTVEGQVTLVRWLKAEGDTVALGEPLFEVETDKGVSEVEAAVAGVLLRKVLAEGAKAGPGDTIALMGQPGEAGMQESPSAVPEPPRRAAAATPVIAALAEKWDVDLARVKGTGPGGRITREDVLRERRSAGAASARDAALAQPARPARVPELSLSRSQAIVARKVSESSREKPVYRVNALVDMSEVINLRATARDAGMEIVWDAFLVKAAAMAITEMPLFKRWFKGEELREHDTVDIAVAVGVDEDLFVPASRDPYSRPIEIISSEIAALAGKARARLLQPADVEGSCFLVSNLGMFPIESFDAIIYPDHSAALTAGSTIPTPVSDGEKISVAPLARLSLTVDHRLINGKVAARFISRVKEILEKGAFA